MMSGVQALDGEGSSVLAHRPEVFFTRAAIAADAAR